MHQRSIFLSFLSFFSLFSSEQFTVFTLGKTTPPAPSGVFVSTGLLLLCHDNTQSDITYFGLVTWLNEWQIKQIGVRVLIWPGPVLGDLGATSRRTDGWVDGRVDGWRCGGPTVHCRWLMVCEEGRSGGGEGTEMDWLVIGSPDPDPCSWVPSSTLDPQWRDTFTANGEISCDLSFSHVSLSALKKTKTKQTKKAFCCWSLTVGFSLLLIGSTKDWSFSVAAAF